MSFAWHARAWGAAALVAALASGCARRAEKACRADWELASGASATEACKAAAAARPELSGLLAWAQFASGQTAEARRTADQAGEASGVAELVRAALASRGGDPRAQELLEQAVRRCRAEGEGMCAVRGDLLLFGLHAAKARYRQALEVINAAAAEPALARNPLLRARTFLRLFDLLYEIGDEAGAERALATAGESGSLTADDLPYLKIKQGNLRAMQARPALARAAYLEAIESAQRVKATNVEWSARLNLVKAAAREGQAAEAAAQLALAEPLFASQRQRSSQVALHYHRALALRAGGDVAGAVRELTAASALGPADDWRFDLEVEKAQALRQAGDTEQAMQACGAAIEAALRLRAEMGADELKAHLLPARRRPFELLFELQARAGQTLPALQTAERALARTFLDAFVEARAPSRDPGDALARAESLQSFLPSLHRSPVVAPRPIEQVLAELGDRRALLWIDTGEGAWLADVRRSAVKLISLRVTSAGLHRLVDALRAAPGDGGAAEALGAALLGPARLEPGEELYLVAEGPLAEVPFAVLRHGGKALVEEHVLHLAPSLTALAALVKAAPASGGAPVVIADAAGDLPGARDEAAAVGRKLSARPLLGAQASRGAVREAAGASVLHLALHAGVGLPGAFLQLADGEVTSADVLAWRLHPRLVVLSACASAATRAREPWGSMASSFLAAGSRAVVASLWSIDDAATRALAERFYQEGGPLRPAEALARAQRAQLARLVPARDWAGFVAYGE